MTDYKMWVALPIPADNQCKPLVRLLHPGDTPNAKGMRYQTIVHTHEPFFEVVRKTELDKALAEIERLRHEQAKQNKRAEF